MTGKASAPPPCGAEKSRPSPRPPAADEPGDACRRAEAAALQARFARDAAYTAEANATASARQTGEHALVAATAAVNAQALADSAAEAEARAEASARLARRHAADLARLLEKMSPKAAADNHSPSSAVDR